MKLIADSGSTKTNWCLEGPDNSITYFDTEGFNPYYVDSDYIYNAIIAKLPAGLPVNEVTGVNYYSAGCSGDKNHIVADALKQVFPSAEITVEHDLLAAARAVLGNTPGFVAILGTGANSCIYNGKEITAQVDSLGFILGDEGSGAYIGKQLLIKYGRGQLPEDLRLQFWDAYHLTPDDIINQVYTKPMPNRFCAGFCKFIIRCIEHPYINSMVRSAFADFFDKLVILYPNYTAYSLNCIGSIGHAFSAILTEVAESYGMKTDNILKAPLEGLVKYHTQEIQTIN
ncbi:MAG: N-acetylglucosamine kinase [Sphingobacteriaceae bacterium]|nr:MAG: N-acetylglucosamine kinase [Sphingobacteriaceae bacterium]